MRTVTPEGFDMVIAPVPGVDASTFSYIDASAGEPFVVFANGKNPVAGMEFLRCLMSKEGAKFFAQKVGSIMPVTGGAEGVELSSAMTSALGAVEAAGSNLLRRPSFGDWYAPLSEEVGNSTGSLMTGRITPEEFIERVQEASDEVKADEDIPKYTR